MYPVYHMNMQVLVRYIYLVTYSTICEYYLYTTYLLVFTNVEKIMQCFATPKPSLGGQWTCQQTRHRGPRPEDLCRHPLDYSMVGLQ